MVFLERSVAGFNRQFSALGHRVPGIQDEIDDHLLDLNWVYGDAAERRGESSAKLDVLVDQPGQEPLGFPHDGVEVYNLRIKNLPPAEGEQLASKGSGTVRRFSNLRHAPHRGVFWLERFRQ